MTPPIRMSRLILWRMALLSLAVFTVSAALVAWQAQEDVQREARSAYALSRMLQIITQLPELPPDKHQRGLEELDAIARSGDLRHLDVAVRDELGRDLIFRQPPAPGSRLQIWLFNALERMLPEHQREPLYWSIPLRGGGRYTMVLTVDPSSERREGMVSILDTLLVLTLSGILLFMAVALSVRQGLSPLRGILSAIQEYRAQRYEQRLPPGKTHEMDAISGALNHLARELADAQKQRAALSGKLLTLQEDERAHLARELHDEFGQTLTAMRADAAYLAQRLRDQPELHAVASELRSHCDHASGDIRNLLKRLRPLSSGTGDPVPLRHMLEELVAGWQARPGLQQEITLDYTLDDDALPPSLALALHRISQEALTNAARHSQARTVRLHLSRDPAGMLHWEAVDDGIGLPTGDASEKTGNGLAGLRERVWAHGGELFFDAPGPPSQPGLRLHARFPPQDTTPPAPA